MRRAVGLAVFLVILLVGLAEAQPVPPAYNTIEEDGTALTRRRTLNFIGAGATCVDNSAQARTDCTLSGGGATPGGNSGDIQINDGAGGFGAYAGDACGANEFASAIDAAGQLTCSVPAGGGAPTDAQYWVGAANGSLSAEKNLGALSTGLVINTSGTPSAYAGSACGSGTDAVNSIDASGAVTCITPSGGGAPTDAKYIVQEANAGLSAEQSLGALTTGLTLNTVTGSTGVLSAYGGTSCTNQFPRSLNASGAATCASVATADVTDANITYAKIQNVTDSRLLGRSSGSSGPPIEITVGSGLSLSGGSLTATGSGGAVFYFTGMTTNAVGSDGLGIFPIGRTAAAASSIDTRALIPADGTLDHLRIRLSAAQGTGDTCTYTVRTGTTPDVTPSSTSITCAVGDTQQGCTDLVNTASVSAGNGIEILFNEAGTCTGQAWFSVRFTPS